jgi:hypothetical protein
VAKARYYSANASWDHHETEARTFSATFFLACLAAMELEGLVLEEI